MATLTLKGSIIHTLGHLPALGTTAPDFTLTGIDLSDISLAQYQGERIILNIFPSLDTPTCATSVRRFNEKATAYANTAVLCISADLPFAQKRFCGAENLTHVIPLSTFRHPEFGQRYGVTITDGLIAGLMSRAIVLIDKNGEVLYTQQVAEIADEPDYDAVLTLLK